MSEQVSLENYKQQVKEWLMKYKNCTEEAADELMARYENILPTYLAENWSLAEAATAMTMGF